MRALDVEGELPDTCLDPNDRPTIPAPRESTVRPKVARIACGAAVVDIVVCDLSRDPRSEDFALEQVGSVSPLRREAAQATAWFGELMALGLVG